MADTQINDQNQLQGTVNNILGFTENATQGISDKGTEIGQTLGTVLSFSFFLILLFLVIALFPKLIRAFTGWMGAIKLPGNR